VLRSATERRLAPRHVRTLRTVETLELIDTPEARQLLRELAKASAGTVECTEAEASLRRLDRSTPHRLTVGK
jgi:hypothetical protein